MKDDTMIRKTLNMFRLALLGGSLITLNAQATEILVPAYFYPNAAPSLSFWTDMTTSLSQGVAITAIMNPNSGPNITDPNDINAYKSAINNFRAAGGKVIGYVSTQFGARDTAAVLSDVNTYHSTYSIDGIFLDEMHNIAATLPYYQNLRSEISNINAGYQVFGNAGTNTLEDYASAADVLITFENHEGYDSYAPAAWTTHYAPSRFAHLLYDVQTTAQMQTYLALAASRNVGYVYITDDRYTTVASQTFVNPWDTLPSYWNAEVAAISSVPEPSNMALFLVGLGLMGWQLQRRQ